MGLMESLQEDFPYAADKLKSAKAEVKIVIQPHEVFMQEVQKLYKLGNFKELTIFPEALMLLQHALKAKPS